MAENPAVMETFIPETTVTPQSKKSKYANWFLIAAILQVVFGLLMASLEIISFIMDATRYYVYLTEPAIWCGIIFCASGAIAFCSWRKATKCNVIAGIVLSVVSILACVCWLFWYEGFAIRLFVEGNVPFSPEDDAYLIAFHVIIMLCSIGQFLTSCGHLFFGIQYLRHKRPE